MFSYSDNKDIIIQTCIVVGNLALDGIIKHILLLLLYIEENLPLLDKNGYLFQLGKYVIEYDKDIDIAIAAAAALCNLVIDRIYIYQFITL